MDNYNHQKIEKKWQKRWEKEGLNKSREFSKKPKFYCLDMFPYPSGAGLHVGHPEGYTATDIVSRYMRMNGYNVLHPMGWDAFGLPAENYAIKTHAHPDKSTHQNIKRFREQIKSIGLSYDWEREIDTSSPDYYKWTQWFFLFLYKNGWAYRATAPVNWCPSCQTVLANEQAQDGRCDRCASEVVQRELPQWFFRITDFAEDLVRGLDELDWPESTKIMQKNWIGRSVGAEVRFPVILEKAKKPGFNTGSFASAQDDMEINIFTTRVDTIFGCTYLVLAPEHKIIRELKDKIENWQEVQDYAQKTLKKTERERMMGDKGKTGVKLKGIIAVNPVNNEEIPIFIADYVLKGYGTGAIMAVPAHDARDFEFAKKFGLEVKQVIANNINDFDNTFKILKFLEKVKKNLGGEGIRVWVLGGLACAFHAGEIYRAHEDLDVTVKDNEDFERTLEILEKEGFEKVDEKKLDKELTNYIFKNADGIEVDIGRNMHKFGLKDSDFEEKDRNLLGVKSLVLSKRFVESFKLMQIKERGREKDKLDLKHLEGKVIEEDGSLVNSGDFNGLSSKEARKKIVEFLAKNGQAQEKVNYKLRDWLISRQRYWGAPIPIIYCEKCGEVPVREEDLPVLLPKDVDFMPHGESPLARSSEFQKVKCPKCGGGARREADTMDTFVCSSWYFLRYTDPKNKKEFANKKFVHYFMPVDLYVGGAEHTVLHLLYSRFFTHALERAGLISSREPFLKLRHPGMVLAEDGRKMSKSLGNVVNPDDVIEGYGADALRLYEMFMGPLEDSIAWSTKGVVGARRFLEKIYKIKSQIPNLKSQISSESQILNSKLNVVLNKTIKKVGEDIKNFKFNTAVSALMILVNTLEKEKNIPVAFWEKFLMILAPFAPHLAEELWSELGHKQSIFKESWPEYNKDLIMEEEIDFAVQINGKTRAKIRVKLDEAESSAVEMAKREKNVVRYLDKKEIKKIIFVKNRLVNFVLY